MSFITVRQPNSTLLNIVDLRTYFHTAVGTVRAVDGVDLTVAKGETVGLVGESGSGKSVLAMSTLQLIEEPGRIEEGSRIEFEGRDLLRLNDRELQAVRGQAISMVFQEPMSALNPVHTVGAQIAEVVRLHTRAGKDKSMRRARELLDLVGIPSAGSRLSDYPHQLSGGMRQRVMIAMALAGNPRLLIADEPTTALDVTIQAQILELLRDLRAEFDMAILLITHDLGVIAEMAHRVAVMYAGRVVERGETGDVLQRPQHPYTEALLNSIPTIGSTYAQPLATIPGILPSPIAWPTGCRFHPRCRYTFARCLEAEPSLLPAANGSVSACWLCEGSANERIESKAKSI